MRNRLRVWELHAGPLLDLACKIFGTESAAVSLMGDSEMYVLEGRGKCSAGDCIKNPGEAGAFCCWSVVPSCASVLMVEDALKDARQAPPKSNASCTMASVQA